MPNSGDPTTNLAPVTSVGLPSGDCCTSPSTDPALTSILNHVTTIPTTRAHLDISLGVPDSLCCAVESDHESTVC